MIDTSGIDIKAVIDQLCSVRWGEETTVSGKRQIKGGPCPLCHQGQDRFIIWPYGDANNPNPRFYCGIHGNGCGSHGDVINFVQQLKGYKAAREAIRDLQDMDFPIGDESARSRPLPAVKEKGAPPAEWQEMGQAYVQITQKDLWSPHGEQARAYLHKRGLTDETIKHFQIGYLSGWIEQPRALWGLPADGSTTTFWIRPGILIPTFVGDTLWKITTRILTHSPQEITRAKETGKDLPRYQQITGSSNSLFNVDAIVPNQPVFVTEGEFDAMIGQQETGLPFVATGSTSGAMQARWVARLGLASNILLAFDNDDGKGEKAAQEWCKIFGDKALLWLPTVKKDITDMWLQKQDIKLWAPLAIASVSGTPIKVAGKHEQDLAAPQIESLSEIEIARAQEYYCFGCWEEGVYTPAPFVAPDGCFRYCRKHYDALLSEVHGVDSEEFAEGARKELPE